MKRIIEIGTGLALSAAVFGGIDASDNNVVNAEYTDTPAITVAGNCSDGTGFNSIPEVSVIYSGLASKIGQFVDTSVNGVEIDNYQVTADKTEHSVQIQSEAGHLDIAAHFSGNTPDLFPVDIVSCAAVGAAPSGDTYPAEVTGRSLPNTGASAVEVDGALIIASGATVIGAGAWLLSRRKRPVSS